MIDKSRKSILKMSSREAKTFLLKPSSYVNIQLPRYFNFSSVIKKADDLLDSHSLIELSTSKTALSQTTDVNYTLLMNKDGRYDWRPLSIVHPVPYVDLVNSITSHWSTIINRFSEFQNDERIQCISVPVESVGKKSDKAETILNWWQNLEQASIRYALIYKYCIKTDVTNCYGSIYTHSISWAIHGKQWSKNYRRPSQGIGNMIDSSIQHLQFGQTNGIPQGSILFDFIAEIILGYSDFCLSKKLENIKESFKIIRYRDDYRIFSNSKELSEKILRELSDVLSDLNMHFNSKKTDITTDIIGSAVKKDKLFWTVKNAAICSKDINGELIYNLGLQKHLLQIYDLAKKYPNSGSVTTSLTAFFNRLLPISKVPKDYQQLMSIVVNIIVQSPRTVPVGIAILGRLLELIEEPNEITVVIDNVINQIEDIPNIGFIEIWLQRLSLVGDESKNYSDPLCQKVQLNNNNVWNSTWLKDSFSEDSIINREYIQKMKLAIPQKEIDLFNDYPF